MTTLQVSACTGNLCIDVQADIMVLPTSCDSSLTGLAEMETSGLRRTRAHVRLQHVLRKVDTCAPSTNAYDGIPSRERVRTRAHVQGVRRSPSHARRVLASRVLGLLHRQRAETH
jgi:hypothetical protein